MSKIWCSIEFLFREIADIVEGHDYVNVTLQSPIHATSGFDDSLGPDFPRLPPKPPKPIPPPTPSGVVSTDNVDISIVERELVLMLDSRLTSTLMLRQNKLGCL